MLPLLLTAGPPVFAKVQQLDPEKLRIAEYEFSKLKATGVVCCSDSPWASPLHMVPKPGGGWRPCGDYRRLNTVTTPYRYPLPNIQDFTNNLRGATVFSKLDLVKGYHQVPIATTDIPKTTIITPFGLTSLPPCLLVSAMPPKPSSASWTTSSATSPLSLST